MKICRMRGLTEMRCVLMALLIMILPHHPSFGASTGRLQLSHRASRQALLFNIGTTPDPNQCSTPDELEGTCTNLVACDALYSRLRTNPTPDFINFLRKSICRYEKSTPVICCPKAEPIVSTNEPIEMTTPSTTTTSSTTTPSTTTPSTTTSSTTTSTTTTTTTTPAPLTTLKPTGEALLPESCGTGADVRLRIVGGTPAPVGKYPWIAALGYEDGEGVIEFLCGGVLITDQHIITAAHCVRNRNDLKVVRLGEHNLDIDDDIQEDFGIDLRMIHENFNTVSFANDIAILKLDKKVIFKNRIKPICLPLAGPFTTEELVARRDPAIVAGWGSVSFNNVSSPILLHVQLPFIPEEECSSKYEVFKQVVIDETTLCAGRGGKDACQGDSGGPMMYISGKLMYLIGVVSFGFRCAEPKFPGVYTKVTMYNEWIISHLN